MHAYSFSHARPIENWSAFPFEHGSQEIRIKRSFWNTWPSGRTTDWLVVHCQGWCATDYISHLCGCSGVYVVLSKFGCAISKHPFHFWSMTKVFRGLPKPFVHLTTPTFYLCGLLTGLRYPFTFRCGGMGNSPIHIYTKLV